VKDRRNILQCAQAVSPCTGGGFLTPAELPSIVFRVFFLLYSGDHCFPCRRLANSGISTAAKLDQFQNQGGGRTKGSGPYLPELLIYSFMRIEMQSQHAALCRQLPIQRFTAGSAMLFRNLGQPRSARSKRA
jgi:hypothetical protein